MMALCLFGDRKADGSGRRGELQKSSGQGTNQLTLPELGRGGTWTGLVS